MCLTINSEGNVNIPNDIKAHEIIVNTIKALNANSQTIDDYLTITGNNTIEGSCSILNYLSVGASSIFSGALTIRTPQQTCGNLQITLSADGNESSIG